MLFVVSKIVTIRPKRGRIFYPSLLRVNGYIRIDAFHSEDWLVKWMEYHTKLSKYMYQLIHFLKDNKVTQFSEHSLIPTHMSTEGNHIRYRRNFSHNGSPYRFRLRDQSTMT